MARSEVLRLVTANRLRDGVPVYRTAKGCWATAIDAASLVPEAEADALLAESQAGPPPLPVVAPYIIEAVREGPKIEPVALREQIRATGPTV
jgi:sulfite reductase (NADPH) hemoprotein beta-component